MCAGCDSMKRAVARRALPPDAAPAAVCAGVGSVCMEVVEAVQRESEARAGGVAPRDRGCSDGADNARIVPIRVTATPAVTPAASTAARLPPAR